jgi:tetratricopeptide (TPR) repeat protein
MDEELRQWLTLGRGYYDQKQYAKAERFLAQVVERTQSFADVYNMLGMCYHDQGQFTRSQRAFEAALRINPGYTEAALNLSVIYNDMGKYAEAREVSQKALSRHQESSGPLDPYVKGKIANMYADIGDAYASAGCGAEAAAEYERALALCPTFVDIRLKLGHSFRDQSQHERALTEYQSIVAQNPSYLPARVAVGVSQYALGKKAEALAAWESVLQQAPGHAGAEMYLALVKGQDAAREAQATAQNPTAAGATNDPVPRQ